MTGSFESSFPDPNASTGLKLWRVTNSWQRTIRAALAPFDLTQVQFVLLAVLTSMDRTNPVTQQDLATHAATDPMMTSQVLRALEQKGLIERQPHPSDRRARTLSPTPNGVRLANVANEAVERADRAYFAILGDDVPGFTRALATLDSSHGQPEKVREEG